MASVSVSNHADNDFPNLHGWVGIGTIALYAVQWLAGFVVLALAVQFARAAQFAGVRAGGRQPPCQPPSRRRQSSHRVPAHSVMSLTTTAALPCSSVILSHTQENYVQQEDTCLQGQDLNVTNASVADQEMALQMDNMSSPSAVSNPEHYSGMENFPVLPSYALDQHGEQASAPNASGSELMGSIPELECFRIDEDNSIPEEDEYQDRLPGSVDVNCSYQRPSGRKALQDITELCQNSGNSLSLSARCMDTGNIDLSAESFSSEINQHSNIRNEHDIIKPKGSHRASVKRQGKVSRSLLGRSSTIEKLNSQNGRHRSKANADRQSEPSNIVANATSFIPLVKQKLQPTTACVKKDVKVKALKAAEAAKRLEEKKQKEQEMRKAAAKVERERLKREKELKQKLEQEQKKKRDEEEKKKREEEEQKKKREVDAATKKRQREEGEKRETMRKRKCIDETRKQQMQNMDRRRGTKDDKDARQKPSSYEMSPYIDSDEEHDDDFEQEQESRRGMKFIPSWTRKENLDKILLSNKTLDPREIFARKLSFNMI